MRIIGYMLACSKPADQDRAYYLAPAERSSHCALVKCPNGSYDTCGVLLAEDRLGPRRRYVDERWFVKEAFIHAPLASTTVAFLFGYGSGGRLLDEHVARLTMR